MGNENLKKVSRERKGEGEGEMSGDLEILNGWDTSLFPLNFAVTLTSIKSTHGATAACHVSPRASYQKPPPHSYNVTKWEAKRRRPYSRPWLWWVSEIT